MAKGLRLREDNCIFKCPQCAERYDFAKESRLAKNGNKKNIYCPHCGKRIGVVQ